MRKRIIMAALFATAIFTAAMADNAQTLVINGEKVEKVVSQITFSGDNVVLHFDGDEATYPMDDVEISFTQTAGINSLNTFRLNGIVGGTLQVSGLAEGTPVSVYDASGKKLAETRANGETTQVALDGMAPGIYILKAGNQIVKFVKR